MHNYAGYRDKDAEIAAELAGAGIEVVKMPESYREKREVKTNIIGNLNGWTFERGWYYWVAKGPGIPLQYAEPLHEKFGKEVRVEGHCGCPSPREYCKGFAIGCYHVDTQEGLNALADTIRQILKDNEIVDEIMTIKRRTVGDVIELLQKLPKDLPFIGEVKDKVSDLSNFQLNCPDEIPNNVSVHFWEK